MDAVGDPGLAAVDHIALVVALGARAHGLQIGAAIRLGQADAAAQLARGEARQIGPLHGLAAMAFHRRGHDEMGIEKTGHRHPDCGDALHHFGIGQGRQAEAAVFGRNGHAKEAEFAQRRDDAFGIFVGGFQGAGMRPHLAL